MEEFCLGYGVVVEEYFCWDCLYVGDGVFKVYGDEGKDWELYSEYFICFVLNFSRLLYCKVDELVIVDVEEK